MVVILVLFWIIFCYCVNLMMAPFEIRELFIYICVLLYIVTNNSNIKIYYRNFLQCLFSTSVYISLIKNGKNYLFHNWLTYDERNITSNSMDISFEIRGEHCWNIPLFLTFIANMKRDKTFHSAPWVWIGFPVGWSTNNITGNMWHRKTL